MKHSGFKRKPSKVKKRKKGETTKLNDKLWALIRQKVFEIYGKNCYTCPQTNLSGANLQGGHVPWPKSILSTECKFDIRFIRPQCMRCNVHHGGMGAVALEKMRAEGIDTDELKRYNEETKGKKYGDQWLKEKILLISALPQTIKEG